MIEARGLYKKFGDFKVLNGVDLRVEEGKSIAIIGRSGGGKSVLLKHLIGLLKPDAGSVWIDGLDITHLTERELLKVRRKFAMVFQGAALFDSLTVSENVAFMLRREKRFTDGEITKKVEAALDMVDLQGAGPKMPVELSGGMRKRVGLARAVIYQPEIVLYDEPTTGLDPVVSDSIDQLILRVNEYCKVTTVVVTHDMRSARRIGQRIFMLANGIIHMEGSPDDIFGSSDPLVSRFVNGIADTKDIDL